MALVGSCPVTARWRSAQAFTLLSLYNPAALEMSQDARLVKSQSALARVGYVPAVDYNDATLTRRPDNATFGQLCRGLLDDIRVFAKKVRPPRYAGPQGLQRHRCPGEQRIHVVSFLGGGPRSTQVEPLAAFLQQHALESVRGFAATQTAQASSAVHPPCPVPRLLPCRRKCRTPWTRPSMPPSITKRAPSSPWRRFPSFLIPLKWASRPTKPCARCEHPSLPSPPLLPLAAWHGRGRG